MSNEDLKKAIDESDKLDKMMAKHTRDHIKGLALGALSASCPEDFIDGIWDAVMTDPILRRHQDLYKLVATLSFEEFGDFLQHSVVSQGLAGAEFGENLEDHINKTHLGDVWEMDDF